MKSRGLNTADNLSFTSKMSLCGHQHTEFTFNMLFILVQHCTYSRLYTQKTEGQCVYCFQPFVLFVLLCVFYFPPHYVKCPLNVFHHCGIDNRKLFQNKRCVLLYWYREECNMSLLLLQSTIATQIKHWPFCY